MQLFVFAHLAKNDIIIKNIRASTFWYVLKCM